MSFNEIRPTAGKSSQKPAGIQATRPQKERVLVIVRQLNKSTMPVATRAIRCPDPAQLAALKGRPDITDEAALQMWVDDITQQVKRKFCEQFAEFHQADWRAGIVEIEDFMY